MTNIPITHGGPNRQYQLCQCSKCNVVQQCTPRFDFYTTTGDNGPLMCEDCFNSFVYKPVDNLRKGLIL